MKNINTTHENGVALIFALGLLTLMSVLGVAFVTNSLTAQKTAVNIGAKNQAQVLMDSAVNRIMISLMGIMQQAPGGANDYSTIYSTSVAGKKGDANTTWDQLDGYSGNSPANKLENSKLSTASGEGLPEYDGSKSNANWVYIKDKDGYVIGRMAYQVLPVGRSSMSLDQVLLGIYNHDKTNADDFGKPGTSSVLYPWNVRIGKDIREFNIGKAFANGDAPFKLEWKYDGSSSGPYYDAQFPGNIYKGDYTQDEPFRAVESFEKFFAGLMFQNIIAQTDAEKREQQINWFKHWFNESKNAYREVFLVAGDNNTKMENAEPFFRFNLSDRSVTSGDKWYSRFNNADKKNSEDVVKELLGPAEPWIEMKTSPKTAIPYLARIAKEPGSFENIEHRRYQIAANLNDYCDEDSIPTSDISAEEWSGPSAEGQPGKMPQYTGNEKTPYINEFVLGVKLENFVSLFGSSAASSIKFDLTPKFYTELIDIYGGATADYELKSWFRKLSYDIEVTAKVKVTFEDDSTEEIEDVNSQLKDNAPLAVDTAFSSAVSKDANDASAGFQDGYWVVVNDLKDQKKTAEFQIDDAALKNKMTADNKDKVIKNRELVSYKVTVKKITLGLAAVGLFSTTGTKPGVDFVKGPSSAIESTGEVVFELDKTNKPVTATTAKDWDTFYLSGMEVRDPRQNLNFTKNQQGTTFKADASDWKCVPVLQSALAGNITDSKVGSLEMKDNGTKIAFAGKVNSCSNPKEPFNSSDNLYDTGSAGVAGVDYDKENAIDPAWLGEHGSLVNEEKHLSTAFIRNAPMQSLWELGVIHRAAAWQTINLKRAVVSNGGTPRRINLTDFKSEEKEKSTTGGVAYVDGDAVLLDQVKLTEDMKSSGKLDVNMLFEDPDRFNLPANWNKNIAKALFYNIAIGQQVGDLYDSGKIGATGTRFSDWNAADLNRVAEFLTNKTKDSSTPQYGEITSVIPNGRNEEKYISRADFIEGPYDPASTGIDKYPRTLACGFGLVSYDDWANKSDAQQEEIIGKTANLITVGATPQTSINAIVVVQTIKPIKVDQDTVVVKEVYKKNGQKVARGDIEGISLETDINLPALKISADNKSFKFGRFTDSDGKVNFIYWDEITSELRAWVTIKEHTDSDGSTRFQLSNIKYLGN